MSQDLYMNEEEKTTIKTMFGVHELLDDEVLYVSKEGVFSSKRGIVSGFITEDEISRFKPHSALIKNGIVIISGTTTVSYGTGYRELFMHEIRKLKKPEDINNVLEKVDYVVIKYKGRTTVKTPNGIVIEEGGFLPKIDEPIVINNIGSFKYGVSKSYLDFYKGFMYTCREQRYYDYNNIFSLVYKHPVTLLLLGKMFGYIPEEPKPGISPGNPFTTKGVLEEDTLVPYVNPATFDLIILSSVAERNLDGAVEELVQTILHEMVHAGRDFTGESEYGTWILGTPFGEEAKVERLASSKILHILRNDKEFWDTIKALVDNRARLLVEENYDTIIDLAVLVDRLKQIHGQAWIHTGDIRVIEEDGPYVKLEIAIVTEKMPRINASIGSDLRNLTITHIGDDRVYVELELNIPSLDEYDYLPSEEE